MELNFFESEIIDHCPKTTHHGPIQIRVIFIRASIDQVEVSCHQGQNKQPHPLILGGKELYQNPPEGHTHRLTTKVDLLLCRTEQKHSGYPFSVILCAQHVFSKQQRCHH
jgi:hypothetical protein